MKKWNGFDFGDFKITKREILASISIIAVLLLIGFIISGKISDHAMDKNEKYNKAVKIKEQDLFEYGMRTDIGNAFIYGDLEAVDTVTYPEIGGKYMYKSTSNTAQTGGSWSDTQPNWESGKYIWTRSHITFSNGNTTTKAPATPP